jgi:AcrR family transcriptional regulator
VPTGVALRDVRGQLFEAAERVLLRDGPNALTSRAVTTEAAVAKGVLHRHFTDFDDFLAELVRDRISRVNAQAVTLQAAGGTGSVAGNLAEALTAVFGPVAVAIVGLVIARDELRIRLRADQPKGIPLLAEATAMLTEYLATECELGRIAVDTDVESLALLLIGAGHLLFADREGVTPKPAEVLRVVDTAMADVLQRRLL